MASQESPAPSAESSGEGVIPSEGAIPPQQGPGQPEGATPPKDGQGETALDKALKSERDARKKAEKELADLRKKADEGLSESEKLTRRVAELEAAGRAAERQALVLRIATETGLPPALASRLHGDDETSLRADAESLRTLVTATPPGTATPPTPTVGGPQGPPPASRSPEDWRTVLRSRR